MNVGWLKLNFRSWLNIKSYGLLFLIAAIYLLAWIIQDRLLLNWDVAYFLHAAELMLAGGNYLQDFFTPNPPLIIYLSMLPFKLSQYFHSDLHRSMCLYVFALASLSLMLCYILVKKIQIKTGIRMELIPVLMATLTVIFLIVPSYAFGQREHLLVILTMPYLLLMAYRIEGGIVYKGCAMMVGLLAALGYAIKPQFIFTLIFIELYYSYIKKNIWTAWRVETKIILWLFIFYVVSSFVLYPEYFLTVLPYVLHYYYNSIANVGYDYLWNPMVFYCLLPVVFYMVRYPCCSQPALCTVLLLALGGFLLSYVSQRTDFYYHIIPAFSFAILLSVLLFALWVTAPNLNQLDYGGMVLLASLVLVFLYLKVKAIWTVIIFSPILFFSFFTCLFTLMWFLMAKKNSVVRMFIFIPWIIALGYLSFYLAQHTSWTYATFPITVFVLVSLFGLFSQRETHHLLAHILMGVVGVLLFAYPACFIRANYWLSMGYQEKVFNPITTFIRSQHRHQSIYAFSIKGSYVSPAFYYTNSQLAQRFDCLWPIASFIRQQKTVSLEYLKDKIFFIKMVVEDLQRQRPNLIFIDKKDAKLMVKDKHYDYLAFFLQNLQFRNEWKAYHYLTTLTYPAGYQLAVYQRDE